MRKAALPLLLGVLITMTIPAQISVLGTLTRYREAKGGEEYEGTISLKNAGDETAQAKIYLRDYSFSADGTTSYPDPGTLERSNADWISLSAATAVLAPGETAEVNYTVYVPASEALAGTYWSVIMVEGIPEEKRVTEEEQPLISIREVMRYAVQIVSDFPEAGASSLRFSGTRILSAGEGKFFSVDIINDGSRWLSGDIYLELYDSQGNHVASIPGDTFRTYPGTSVRKALPLAGYPAGTYKALLVADCGGSDLFGGNYNLVIRE